MRKRSRKMKRRMRKRKRKMKRRRKRRRKKNGRKIKKNMKRNMKKNRKNKRRRGQGGCRRRERGGRGREARSLQIVHEVWWNINATCPLSSQPPYSNNAPSVALYAPVPGGEIVPTRT